LREHHQSYPIKFLLNINTNNVSVAPNDWDSPYGHRAIRIHILRRTGAPSAEHPFLEHPWYANAPDEGIAWGVLSTPTIRTLVIVLQNQHVEEPIRSPRYLIGATGHGASMLRRRPSEPLPLSELIFLYKDADVRAWLLANPGKDPLDLLVLEKRQRSNQGRAETPEPVSGRHPFFDRKTWDRFGSAEMEEDDYDTDETDGADDTDDDGDDGDADFRETIIVDDDRAGDNNDEVSAFLFFHIGRDLFY